MRILRVLLTCVLAAALLATGAATAAQAEAPVVKRKSTIVQVWHPVVTPTAVLGSGLGTVRTWFTPTTVDGKSAAGQFMTGTLTTVAIDEQAGTEWRTANLVFVVGDEANQLVIGGTSIYPSAGSTLAVDSSTIRPVIGGSGTYDGARGYAVSTNLGARGWSHVFHLKP